MILTYPTTSTLPSIVGKIKWGGFEFENFLIKKSTPMKKLVEAMRRYHKAAKKFWDNDDDVNGKNEYKQKEEGANSF